MRYVVLVRYGLRDLRPVLTVERLADGSVSCREMLPPNAEGTWHVVGRTHGRLAPAEPQVIYSVPGPRLLDPALPIYDWEADSGATIQLSGEEVLDQPQLVTLQILVVPHGQQPLHRETVGDRRMDEGQPDIWVVLHRRRGEPPDQVAAALRPRRLPPPLWLHAESRSDPERR